MLALILTHSHEDHYGAVLDLWPAFDRPVYATAFTAAMLAPSVPLDNIVAVAIRTMQVGGPFTLGPFTIEASTSPTRSRKAARCRSHAGGRVIHTGDWKLDPRPDRAANTMSAVRALGAEASSRLICDSTNALKKGQPREDEVAATLPVIAEAPHRVA